MNWSSIPFVRIFLFYSGGVLTCIHSSYYFNPRLTIILLALLLPVAISLLMFSGKKYTNILIPFLLFTFGMLYTSLNHNNSKREIHNSDKEQLYVVTVQRKIAKSGYKAKMWDTKMNFVTHVLLKADKSDTITEGQHYLVKSRLKRIKNYGSSDFDYQQYMAYKGLYYEIRLQKNRIQYIYNNKSLSLNHFALKIRNAILLRITNHLSSIDHQTIASALLIGYDDEMSKEQKQVFAEAGTMHILCVSGLHVGIVYLLVRLCFGFLIKLRGGKYLYLPIAIGCLVIYCFITGLSPSVCRASLMLSLYLIMKLLNREGAAFHTLALSGTILLLVNPFQIMHIGFQLSFSAVFFILLLYKPIVSLYNPSIKPLAYIWQITVISICAQIGTAPMAIFYFHQFSSYFLISNLFAIPLASLVIYLGVAALIFNWHILYNALEQLINILQFLTHQISSTPNSSIKNIFINTLEAVDIYVIILLIYLLLKKWSEKKKLVANRGSS